MAKEKLKKCELKKICQRKCSIFHAVVCVSVRLQYKSKLPHTHMRENTTRKMTNLLYQMTVVGPDCQDTGKAICLGLYECRIPESPPEYA